MDYNYHTHTCRCGHASGSSEAYIERAIECDIKYMGFSDHMPYICSDGYESGFRVPVAEAEAYFQELSALREKYQLQIDIKIGFEMEYYPRHFQKMLKSAISFGAEYLILGQHFNREEHPVGIHNITGTDGVNVLREYVDCVVSAIKSGVFTYIAHPDMFYFTGSEDMYRTEMRKICRASKTYDVPLEINFLGIREGRIYPNEVFWKIAGEEGSPVTFGFDAHDVESAFDSRSLKMAEALVKKYGLNYVGRPKTIGLRYFV